jgi:hypothetical protein
MMVVAWLVFPVVLGALALGCGLLLERISRMPLDGVLLLPAGVAMIAVIAQIATVADATADLATPVIAACAIAGIALARPWRGRAIDPWALACAIAVFAAFAAPVALAGEPTFAGYIKLDDTATWFTLTDRVMDHGRSLDGLAPSSYEATLAFNLGDGYPIGVFLPLGVARELTGIDVAWVFQPYLAFIAAMLALAFYALVTPLVEPRPLRAAVAFLGAQPALLFGYALWGGIKEVTAAALIALIAALVPRVVVSGLLGWSLLPVALAIAALLAGLGAGGSAWLAPLLLVAVVAAVARRGFDFTLRQAGLLAIAIVVLSVPLIVGDAFIPPTSAPLTSSDARGNLLEPLSPLQFFGIWPDGDFRVRPTDLDVTRILIGVEIVAAALALAWAWRRRAWGFLGYVLTASGGCLAIVALGSPWVDAKALATASPAFVFAGAAGAAVLATRRRAIEAVVLAAAIAAGVLWSNALAFHEVSLAPHDRLEELRQVGEEIAGEGPTLMTDYEPYGVRHFLREADPEGASELRRREVPLRSGAWLARLGYADIDEFRIDGVLVYRTLVLRRSAAGSRPPSVYTLVRRGRFYDVWQRPEEPALRVLDRLPLGARTDATGIPRCRRVLALANRARASGPKGTLAVARHMPIKIALLPSGTFSRSWEPTGVAALTPHGPGNAELSIETRTAGRYGFWIGGSFRGALELRVDGRPASRHRHWLSHTGPYQPLGEMQLGPGPHQVTLRYSEGDLHPGSGGRPFPLGPLLVGQGSAERAISFVAPADALSLCGRRLDWVEAVAPR